MDEARCNSCEGVRPDEDYARNIHHAIWCSLTHFERMEHMATRSRKLVATHKRGKGRQHENH